MDPNQSALNPNPGESKSASIFLNPNPNASGSNKNPNAYWRPHEEAKLVERHISYLCRVVKDKLSKISTLFVLDPNPDSAFWGLNPNPTQKTLDSRFES